MDTYKSAKTLWHYIFGQIGGFKAARATLGVRQLRQLAKLLKPQR
jgi:hypothetical protein